MREKKINVCKKINKLFNNKYNTMLILKNPKYIHIYKNNINIKYKLLLLLLTNS